MKEIKPSFGRWKSDFKSLFKFEQVLANRRVYSFRKNVLYKISRSLGGNLLVSWEGTTVRQGGHLFIFFVFHLSFLWHHFIWYSLILKATFIEQAAFFIVRPEILLKGLSLIGCFVLHYTSNSPIIDQSPSSDKCIKALTFFLFTYFWLYFFRIYRESCLPHIHCKQIWRCSSVNFKRILHIVLVFLSELLYLSAVSIPSILTEIFHK